MAKRGTTPEYEIIVNGYDLTECKVIVYIKQSTKELRLEGDRLTVTYDDENDSSSIAFKLTQQETLNFSVGRAEIQVRFIDSEGNAEATDIGAIKLNRILNDEVISYD